MKVRITRATNNPWYKDLIGREYEVEEYNSAIWKLINSDLTIYKQDCEIISDDSLEQLAEKLVRSIREINEKYGLKFKEIEKQLGELMKVIHSPTDEEIIERIRHENEKAGWWADWDKLIDKKYYLENYNGTYGVEFVYRYKALGTTYTNQQIAEQIVSELNEKRFVRV